MTDTKRTLRALQALAADNTAGDISAQDLRDLLVTVYPDPVDQAFGTPDTAHEFQTSSLTGLTAVGTPDTENANTTVADHLYIQDDASTTALCGRYIAAPDAPFTAITKVIFNAIDNWSAAGIFVGESTPGDMEVLSVGPEDANAYYTTRHETFTAPDTFSTTNTEVRFYGRQEAWLAIRVNTASDVDFLVSDNGVIWRMNNEADNPGLTLGSVGVVMKAEDGGVSAAAAWDYLRVWESALTFPGE